MSGPEESSRRQLQLRAALVARFAVPAILIFMPQMLFWWRIYGSPFLRPPGAEFLPLWKPRVLLLLLSTWNGAFVWSPVLLLGLAGWWRYPERALRVAVLDAVVLEIYVCALVLDWWGGRGVGARRLASLAPLAAVGLRSCSEAEWCRRHARDSGWRSGS